MPAHQTPPRKPRLSLTKWKTDGEKDTQTASDSFKKELESTGFKISSPLDEGFKSPLTRTFSIQSMARSHKLLSIGSFTTLVGTPTNKDNAPLSKHTMKSAAMAIMFGSKHEVLDPLRQGGMKRINSTPMMRMGRTMESGVGLEPTLEQITESEERNELMSPVKQAAPPKKVFEIPKLDAGLFDNDYGEEVYEFNDEDDIDPVADDSSETFTLTLPNFGNKQPNHRPMMLTKLDRMTSFEDDDDWGQVSDEDNDINPSDSLNSPRADKPRLSVHANTSQADSYKFTGSGGIDVEGLNKTIASGITYRDRLVFLQKLGSGASGIVYLCLDLETMTLVAVKIINIFEKSKRRQMVHELASLNDITLEKSNPNIVGFIDAFTNAEDGTVGLIVEYMDGGSLEDIVQQGGCGDEDVLASMSKQMLTGLKFLHEDCHQLHRDIKPANVLINGAGDVKISDFGIAKNVKTSDEEKMSEAKTFVGTLTFMSPERINGGNYGYGADVWSLGLTILTTALGKLPLETEGGYWSVMACVREEDAPTLPQDGKWSDSFRDFLAQCLTKDENLRPTCAKLLEHPFVLKAKEVAETEDIRHRDAALADLENILEAVVVHAKKMIERGTFFMRGNSSRHHEMLPTQLTLVNMLSEMVLKKPELLANLAKQLELDVDDVRSNAIAFCHKAAAASYLDDSDED
jgi:serine/threonine protein kinase